MNSIPKVYFSKKITPAQIVKMYKILEKPLEGPIALKIHSGEAGNPNFLKPELFLDLYKEVSGTIVETNTAYQGKRFTNDQHEQLLSSHGWTTTFSRVEILDRNSPDKELQINNPQQISKNYLGSAIENYKSMIVLAHFKGHSMGGYGGALKQLSIGCASKGGKTYIHTAGKTTDPQKWLDNLPEQDQFLRSMADAAGSVVRYFKGNMAFINIMKNISIDCDCAKNASLPCMGDIGICSSLDPVAIDTACLDLIINSNDPGKVNFLERLNQKHGFYTIDVAEKIGFGTKNYQLINLD